MLKGREDEQEDVSSYRLISMKRGRYLKFKEEELVRNLCGTRFERGYVPVVIQNI